MSDNAKVKQGARRLRRLLVLGGLVGLSLIPVIASGQEFDDIKNQLSDQNRKAAEASQQVSNVDAQLKQVRQQIFDTNAKISFTNQAIAEAEARMADKKAVLAQYVEVEYKHDHQTDLEILVGSSSISQFVDRQEYLKSGRNKITEAVAEVLKIKKELDGHAAELAGLNSQLHAQQNALNYELAQSQNQLAAAEAARAELKHKLAKYAGGHVVSAGDYVRAGDLVGFEGSSGCSTGSHVHFEVQRLGAPLNPRVLTPGRLKWPLENFGVNQEFGPPNWAAPYSFHTGIDINAYFGAPVYAAAAGTVTFSGYDHSGFGDHVQIDHGGGLSTIYGHLGARASDYPNC